MYVSCRRRPTSSIWSMPVWVSAPPPSCCAGPNRSLECAVSAGGKGKGSSVWACRRATDGAADGRAGTFAKASAGTFTSGWT